jgi:hypothetical protein
MSPEFWKGFAIAVVVQLLIYGIVIFLWLGT